MHILKYNSVFHTSWICLFCFQKIFKQNGGILGESEKVLDICPEETVTVKTNKAEYRCGKIVITAGAWAGKVLKPLGLHVPLQVILDAVKSTRIKY